MPSDITYQDIGPDEIDLIEPLWEKLRAHHRAMAWRFAAEMDHGTFPDRKKVLLAKPQLRVDLAKSDGRPVAYCVTSLSPDGAGQLDSIYVDDPWRGRGIGKELVRRALAWLDQLHARSKTVSVAYGNDPATKLYESFGFHPRTITMKQVPAG